MKILEWIKGVKVGTDGYELEEFEKPDGGAVGEKVKQKLIYNGPLSVVSTPENLDGGEKFSNWDQIVIYVCAISDAADSPLMSYLSNDELIRAADFYTDSGRMTVVKLSDTSFQLVNKTTANGNVARIYGIKL